MLIRKAKPSDADQIYKAMLYMFSSEDHAAISTGFELQGLRKKRIGFKKSATRELVREIKERKAIFFVATISGQIVGYARGRYENPKDPFLALPRLGHIEAVCVSKDFQNKGIGSRLMAELDRWFKDSRCKYVFLEVFEANPAIAIYKARGYKTLICKMVKRIKLRNPN